MTIRNMYKEMEGHVVHFPNGNFHPTIVEDVGNSTPVDITVKNGFAYYKDQPLRLTAKGWWFLFNQFKEGVAK